MQMQPSKKSWSLLVGALLFAGCGPEAAQEASPADQASASDRPVRAMTPPNSCDESVDVGWCRVYSDRVPCNNGIEMYAIWTPDGWCIPRDVCKYSQGPEIICPQ
ncbi:hypothetical protein HRD49_36770 [Corallococcus exiguus]|uniref:hypothetical protein n=1 Tax=Corallococcus TaxID=83461 RepID=UPI000F860B7A|nr:MULTISPECIES: hypothetical protein [Corallococcus]NNC22443.1 hypothetical protein [Corallococcus exiguus]NRD54303.1 hypothetical protein [Corallococcus exiguus]NRD67307.1 hypothetical protein [Corallococcus exiguus]